MTWLMVNKVGNEVVVVNDLLSKLVHGSWMLCDAESVAWFLDASSNGKLRCQESAGQLSTWRCKEAREGGWNLVRIWLFLWLIWQC